MWFNRKRRALTLGTVGLLLLAVLLSAFLVGSVPESASFEDQKFVFSKREQPPFRAYPFDVRTEVKAGDTFANILNTFGFSPDSTYRATLAMKTKDFDLGLLKEGQELWLRKAAGDNQLAAFRIDIDDRKIVTLDVDNSSEITIFENTYETNYFALSGVVESSLYKSLLAMDLSDKAVISFIDIFGFDVDFQRDIHKGNRFTMVYGLSTLEGSDSNDVRVNILKASLESGPGDHTYYLYNDKYYDESGKSAQKALMRTPISGARLSSGYGMRKHPIKGYMRKHSGVDFAAPQGTPIYAAGDGVIEKRVYAKNGYGRYLIIRHNSTYKTLYAHMNAFAKGTKVGQRVKQRQVIGYVGSTGLSTGPHLHYEVIKNNQKINPGTLRLPEGKTVNREALPDFTALVNNLNTLDVDIADGENLTIDSSSALQALRHLHPLE